MVTGIGVRGSFDFTMVFVKCYLKVEYSDEWLYFQITSQLDSAMKS